MLHCQLSSCQVPGCAASVEQDGNYFVKRRICREHSAAKEICIDGVVRFCQQCSRMHPVEEFDSGRKSCRVSLAAHYQRRRHRSKHSAVQPRRYASPSPTDSSSGSGSSTVQSVASRSVQPDRMNLSDKQEQQQGGHMLGLQTGPEEQQQQPGVLLDPQQQELLGMDPEQWLLPLHMPLLHEMLPLPQPELEPDSILPVLDQTQAQPQGPQQGPPALQAFSPELQTAQPQPSAAQALHSSMADALLGAAAAQVTATEGPARPGSPPALCGTKRGRANGDTAALALRLAELVSPMNCVPAAAEERACCSQPLGLTRLLSGSASSGGSYGYDAQPAVTRGGVGGAAATAAAQQQLLYGSAGQQHLQTFRAQQQMQQLQQMQAQAALAAAGHRAALLTDGGVHPPRAASAGDVYCRSAQHRSSSSRSHLVQLLTDMLRNLPAEDMPLLHRVIRGQRQHLGNPSLSAQLEPSMQSGYAGYGLPAAATPETSSSTEDSPDDMQMAELPRLVSVFQAMPRERLPLLHTALQCAQQQQPERPSAGQRSFSSSHRSPWNSTGAHPVQSQHTMSASAPANPSMLMAGAHVAVPGSLDGYRPKRRALPGAAAAAYATAQEGFAPASSHAGDIMMAAAPAGSWQQLRGAGALPTGFGVAGRSPLIIDELFPFL